MSNDGRLETGSVLYTDVTGVILAGGRSRRMGRDKATLDWQGRTLFDRALAALQACLPRMLIAGDRPDLARPGVPCVPDRYPGSALGGLCTALEVAATEWIFVAPCDLPSPDPALVRRILEARDGFDAVVPCTPEGAEPVFAAYRKTCLGPMQDLLRVGNFRIIDFYPHVAVRFLGTQELPPDWKRSLLNLNTPADLQRLQGAVKQEE